ncbi:MAG: cupredoxin domain-containing protein [Actinobacteria bacterium]|nr:cupredoxin domain-containing protein [Actinomycetota bacterium]
MTVLLAGACASGGSEPRRSEQPRSTDGGPVLTVLQRDFAFEPSMFSVASGARITVSNVGATTHTFTVEGGPDIDNVPLASNQVLIDLPRGSYPFRCVYHRQMTGTLTVR